MEKPQIDRYAAIEDQYQTAYAHYAKLLKTKIVVFMQVGSMYEIYHHEDGNNAFEIIKFLGLQIMGNKDGSGFPTGRKGNYCDRLTDEGYTVIIVDEEPLLETDTTPRKQRSVAEIVSPGISLHQKAKHSSVNVVAIYIENQNTKKKFDRVEQYELMVGLAALNVVTNTSRVYQLEAKGETFAQRINSSLDCFEEVYRFLQAHNCKELIIHFNGFNALDEDAIQHLKSEFRQLLSLENYNVTTMTVNEVPDPWTTPRYHHEVLMKIFQVAQPLNFLGLEFLSIATTAYMILLEYVRVRNDKVLQKLSKPIPWHSDDRLILTHNAIQQLELGPATTKDHTGLFDIINHTTTVDGARKLEQLLYQPFANVEKLNEMYDQVDAMKNHKDVAKVLRQIGDLRRVHRKLELQMLSPFQLGKLFESYQAVQRLIKLLAGDETLPQLSNSVVSKLAEYLELLQMTFDFSVKSRGYKTIKDKVLQSGINEEFDQKYELATNVDRRIHNLRLRFARLLEPTFSDEKCLKLVGLVKNNKGAQHFTVNVKYAGVVTFYKDGFAKNQLRKYSSIEHLACENVDNISDLKLTEVASKARKRDFGDEVNFLNDEEVELLKSLKMTVLTSKVKIFSSLISDEEFNAEQYIINFETFATRLYHTLLQELYSFIEPETEKITSWVTNIDILNSHAITSEKWIYRKPQAFTSKASFIGATQIRHPVIERIQNDIAYQPNDINIGAWDDNREANGIFLCGINSSGKSTYLKSVALCTILAQIGCFVPAKTFCFNPFKNLITRLSGMDNMYKRQGSFAVEMAELRTIMRQANQNTLVLGDEICRGTEQTSALPIVAAVTNKLCERRTNFLFSTHLRGLEKFEDLVKFQKDGTLRYMHFTIILDEANYNIIYERKLVDGMGKHLYGIESAAFMGLDHETCNLAYRYRKMITDPETYNVPLGGNKQSRYNRDKLIGLCQIKNCFEKVDDTHHIRHQSEADGDGNIDHFHKNAKHNLLGLCKKHHQMIHQNELEISGFHQTEKGVELK